MSTRTQITAVVVIVALILTPMGNSALSTPNSNTPTENSAGHTLLADPGVIDYQPSEDEPNNNRTTATRISGESIDGAISKTADEDWFVFTANASQVVSVTVEKPQQEGTLDVQLHTATERVDRTRISDDMKFGAVADTSTSATLYYVQVSGRQQTTTDYSIDVQTRPADSFEPNEDQNGATAVEPNTTIDGEASANDNDWFVFTAPAKHRVTATVRKETGDNTDLAINLFTPTARTDRLRLNADESTGFVADTTGQQQVYFVQLSGQSGDDTADYNLSIQTTTTDKFEPNEKVNDATPIQLNASTNGEITEDDVDWFTVTAPADHRLIVTVNKTTGVNSRLEAALFTPEKRISRLQLRDAEQGQLADTTGADRVYYIRVRGGDADDTGLYDLSVIAQPTDAFEPNERSATAVQIDSNTIIEGEISENDNDWFTFTAPAAQAVNVTVQKSTGANTGLDVELFTAPSVKPFTSGARLSQATIRDSQTRGVVADTSGESTVYFVRIRGGQSDHYSPYTMVVRTNSTDGFEPNEDGEEAVAVEPNTTVSGEITVNDQDWFVVTAPSNHLFNATVEKISGGNSALSVELFTPQTLPEDTATSRAQLSDNDVQAAVADTTGDQTVYFVRIQGNQPRDTSPYELTLSTRLTDGFEPNENPVDAEPIDANRTITGEITANDEDWFVIDAAAYERISVRVSTPAGTTSELDVRAYTPDGQVNRTRLDQDETTGRVSFRAPADAVYYIRITSDAEVTKAPYSLTVTVNETESAASLTSWEPLSLGWATHDRLTPMSATSTVREPDYRLAIDERGE